LHERYLVRLDQPHGQTVRERAPLNLRQIQRWRRAKRRRLRTIGRSLGHYGHREIATENTEDTEKEDETTS
jgi:hypothetical protein